MQFVIGPVNPRTTEVRSVCAKLSARQFVRASPGESSASLHSDQERLTFCLFAAPQRRNAGSALAPLFRGVYSLCRSAAGLEPASLSDGRVDPGGMENAASREKETGLVGRRGQLRASGVAGPSRISSDDVTSSQQCRGFTETIREQINVFWVYRHI